MFNIFKRKTDLDIIAQHFNEEARVKAQCDATIHAALFSRYLTVTRMTALADWAKMTDAEKLAACNVQPDELPAAPEKINQQKMTAATQEADSRGDRLGMGSGLHAH